MSIRINPGTTPRSDTLSQAFAELYQQTSRLGFDAMIYDYTPVPTLENLFLNQRITDRYLVDFSKLIAQSA